MMNCYYPTTTIAIDDDADFLEAITKHLGISDCIPYLSPKKAIEVLSRQNSFQRVQARILKTTNNHEELSSSPEDYAVLVSSRGVHEEIYSNERFQDVSVLLVDYHMDEMTGIEVCHALSDHPAKKILLTGGADKERIAIEAFNNGIIHRFVNKSAPDFSNTLKQAVSTLKEAYFRDLSSTLTPHVSLSSFNLFKCPAYINFIKNLQEQFNAVELYTIDSTGSCILLDALGEPIWFIVKHESEIQDFIQLAEDQDAHGDLIQALEERRIIPFFFSDEDYQRSPHEWQPLLHQAQSFPGIKDYYYAICKGHSGHLSERKIVPYASYCPLTTKA